MNPIVFIHEWFTSGEEDWARQVSYFERNHRCILFALPGHPRGPIIANPRQPVFDAGVTALLARISDETEPVHLVAHGMGAVLAVGTIAMAPEKVRSAVLVAPRYRAERHRWLLGLASKLPSIGLPLYIAFHDPVGEHLPLVARYRERRSALSGRNAAAYARAALNRESFGMPDRIDVPVCVISGDQDPLVTMPVAEELNASFRNSRLIRYAHLGHNPHREEPDLVNDAIRHFFAAHESGVVPALRRLWKNLMGDGSAG